MVVFSLAVLAGEGAARLVRRMRSPSTRRALLLGLGALMLVEYASTPELVTVPRNPPEIYSDLLRDRGDSPTAILFEFPTLLTSDPAYLYYSTFHWQTLINGYSGFFPPSYLRLRQAIQNFPEPPSMDAIRERGAQYLIVHGEYLYGNRYDSLIPELDRRPDLRLVSRRPWQVPGKHAEISLYRVLPVP